LIDATYGHLVRDAEDQDRGLLDAYDAAADDRGHAVGTNPADGHKRDDLKDEKAPPERGLQWLWIEVPPHRVPLAADQRVRRRKRRPPRLGRLRARPRPPRHLREHRNQRLITLERRRQIAA
jgi:hypothetical protein